MAREGLSEGRSGGSHQWWSSLGQMLPQGLPRARPREVHKDVVSRQSRSHYRWEGTGPGLPGVGV